MSELAPAWLSLTALIADRLPAVQVLAGPPAADQNDREAIWVQSGTSDFEWRSIGAGSTFAPKNRTEHITLELRVAVFREAPKQFDASAEAIARAEELFAAIEAAVESNGGIDHAEFTIGGTVTSGLISRWSVTPALTDTGWLVTGAATFSADVIV